MAKNQAKKRSKIEMKKAEESRLKNEMNPFEIRHNKIKHKVLGRKIAKNEFGKPLINRNRAYKKREQTLLKEYKNTNKAGHGLRDLREQDANVRMIEKYRQEQNRIDFNHNDIIELTHKGRPLDEMIDDRIDSDDEHLDLFTRDDYVETSHFGGGEYGPSKSKKEILDEIMAEKARIKLQQEETINLTEQLDNKWNEIRNLIRHKGSNQTTMDKKSYRNDYDTLLQQLVFDDKNQVKESSLSKTTQSSTSADDQSTPDGQFRSKLNSIENLNDIGQILDTIKKMIDLLKSKVTRKSFILLKDRLIAIAEKQLKFTPKEMAILIVGAYFKELQTFIHLIILRTLNKIKYSNLMEISCAIFLNNFLLKSQSIDKFCPELFVHVDNLVRLCLPQSSTKIKLFHRLEYEIDCHLNVSKFNDSEVEENLRYKVSLTNLFDGIFKSNDSSLVKYNLAIQIFRLLSNLREKYSSSSTGFMLSSTIKMIDESIRPAVVSKQMNQILEEIFNKFETAEKSSNKSVIIVNNIKPKPFILPLLEPKFEDDLRLKPKYQCERKKLTKKYKREFKGAQREIRKDSKFLRDTYLKEVEKKDRIRKNKVKEILKDLSIQQGLYKKKK
ncbi:nucleolar protein 14 homolog l(3)07882 [Dermatophagoides pteronyssinus]|uniref:nucleolar protein 14 homolog l(3)07882 n=1 Tax=Dermatophagoides pteronyssinus TaxID=6956 RepID=UPI003F668B72